MLYPDGPIPHFMSWPIPAEGEHSKAWQNFRCAMCGARTLSPVMDHDHDTGMTRGLVCRSCNMTETTSDHPAWVAWRAGMNVERLFGTECEYLNIFGAPKVRRSPVMDEAWFAENARLAELVAKLT